MTDPKPRVGVVVMRVQVDQPHPGHRMLISEAYVNEGNALVVLGSPAWGAPWPTASYPLDYITRKMAVEAEFPVERLKVVEIRNRVDDNVAWSRDLDALIEEHFPGHEAVLYGGRDSFLPRYAGKWTLKVEIPTIMEIHGTDIRQEIFETPINDPKFRRGMMYAYYQAEKYWAKPYVAVDIACVDIGRRRVLMGERPGGSLKRFPGGRLDRNETMAQAALRELREETQVVSDEPPTFIGEFMIPDPRFRPDKVLSHLYAVHWQGQEASAADDLGGLDWVSLDDLYANRVGVTPEHIELVVALIRWIEARSPIYFTTLAPTS
jgi:8-oxo-dGTP pyrophosphatase MutT (NUDIX family)